MSLKQSLDVVDDETTVIQYPYKVLADFLFPSPFTLLLNVDENMLCMRDIATRAKRFSFGFLLPGAKLASLVFCIYQSSYLGVQSVLQCAADKTGVAVRIWVVLNSRTDNRTVILVNLLKRFDLYIDSLLSHNAPHVVLQSLSYCRILSPLSMQCAVSRTYRHGLVVMIRREASPCLFLPTSTSSSIPS